MTVGELTDLEAAPTWFADAIATAPAVATAMVDGVPIRYRVWGAAAQRGVVLVHGGGAHARWWDHIGPFLTAGGHRVIAVDLSGHGDSGRRAQYDFDTWAREVVEVTAHAELTGPPIIVGHSMGGLIALRLAVHSSERIGGVIAIDCPIFEQTPEDRAASERRAFGPLRTYPTRAAALARFRPVPDQPCLPYVRAHVAETSIRSCPEGWTWKYDPRIFGGHAFDADDLLRVRTRICMIRAEHGMLSEDVAAIIRSRGDRMAELVELPAAGHHVMFDRPLALVAAVRVLLETWRT